MTTQHSTPTYAYHFAKINDNNDKSLSFNQDATDFTSHFNKISFRYLAQCQQSEKRLNSPQADLSQFSARPEKTSQPLKKYTFSILAKQQKPFRKSENADYVRTATLTPKYPLNLNKTLRSTQGAGDRVENGQQVPFQKSQKQEYKKQTSNQYELTILKKHKDKLQADCEQLKSKSELFKVRFQESNKLRSEQQEQIKRLKQVIKMSQSKIESLARALTNLQQKTHILQEQKNTLKRALQIQNPSNTDLKLYSNVMHETLFSKGIKCKESKELQVKNNFQNYEQQYRELMKLAGLNSETEKYHQKMIRQITKISLLHEQNASLKVVLSEVQRQKSKLWHHLKKNEAELVRVCSLNAFLNSEIAKGAILIGNCNQEINLLNLKVLEQKMMMKYMSE